MGDYGKKWHIFWLPLHHTDFHFKHLNMSFIENKLIVDLNSNCHDCSTQKTEEKLHGFRQTDMVEFLINERKLSMI